ncbi:MAG: WG repeat-containing protein [Oscillospiraceae bacterium]|nr:WG repeat-containing protein [Oscillospiraceae bacterium]
MKKRLTAAVLMTALLMTACGQPSISDTLSSQSSSQTSSGSQESSSLSSSSETSKTSSESSETEQQSSAVSSEESSTPAASSLQPTGRTLLADALIPATTDLTAEPGELFIDPSGVQYYTVQRDGLWGLVDENGQELLSPTAESPVTLCGMGHWCWWPSYEYDPDTAAAHQAEMDEISEQLTEATGYPLCGGHGGGGVIYILEPDGEVPVCYVTLEGAAYTEPLDNPPGGFFPVLLSGFQDGECGPEPASRNTWNFSNASGTLLCPGETFDRVGWLKDAALVPVCKDGKWAYLDRSGQPVTDFVYDSCWSSEYVLSETTGLYEEVSPYLAYELWDGFAPVCRNGKWGVLDSTGTEVIPCQYDGGAPYPGGAWLLDNGIWTLYLAE